MHSIYTNRKFDNRTLFHKLMFGLSLSDILSSATMVLQPFLIPSYTNLPFAHGTNTTCTAMGASMMLVICSYVYSCLISLHFYLTVTSDGRNNSFLSEIWCHILPWGTAILIAVLGIGFQSFGYEVLLGLCLFGCQEKEQRAGCKSSTETAVTILGWSFTIVAVIAAAIGVIFTGMILFYTQSVFRKIERHAFPGSAEMQFRLTQRTIARRAACYTTAFLLSFGVNIIGSVANEIYKQNIYDGEMSSNVVFVALLAMYGGFPIQGFLNFLVYFQPTIARWMVSDGARGYFWAVCKVFTGRGEPPSQDNNI